MSPLAALLLAAATTLDGGLRSEVRVRGTDGAVAADVEATPSAHLLSRSRAWEVDLRYAPRLLLRQVDLGTSFEVLHRAALAASWRGPRSFVTARADGVYGTESFVSLVPEAAAGAPPVEQLPAISRFTYASLRAGAAVTHAASRRWTLTGELQLQLRGGVDEAARAIVPMQVGPVGSLGAELALTRKDRLLSALDASWVTFSSGQEIGLVSASETWRRALGRRVESTLRAGATGALSTPEPGGASTLTVYPVALAALAYRLPGEALELEGSVWVAPVVDRLGGFVDERLQGSVAGRWSVTPRLAVRGQIGAAQSVPWDSERAVRLALGEAAMSVGVSDRLRIDIGTRGALQSPGGASRWIFFTTATFTTQALRL